MSKRKLGRTDVLKMIEKEIKGRIDAIAPKMTSSTEAFRGAVYAYRQSIKIIKLHYVVYKEQIPPQ